MTNQLKFKILFKKKKKIRIQKSDISPEEGP